MSDFDPARTLILTQFKTIHGFRPHVGSPLAIVDEPAKEGDVTEAMARRLWKSGVAVYTDDFRPTPVEKAESETIIASESEKVTPLAEPADDPITRQRKPAVPE